MIKRVNLFFKFWIWPLFYIGFIFKLSSLNISSIQKVKFFYLDKFLHLIEYSILGYLLTRAFKGTTRIEYKNLFLFILIIGFLVGSLDEFYQSFLPYKYSCFSDFISDLVGILAGIVIFRKINPVR